MIEQKPYCWRVPRPPGHLKIGLISKNAAISYPNKEIIDATTGEHRPYKEVDDRSNRIANSLLNCYKPGDFIGVIVRMGIDILEIYFAAAKSGLVIIPISFRLAPKEIENILKYAEAKALIFDGRFKPLVDQINLQLEKYVIGESVSDCLNYDTLLRGDSKEPDIELTDDTIVALGFTSGTTGTPKAYLRTHYANFLNHVTYAISFDMTCQDIVLNMVPPLTGLSFDCGAMLVKGSVINQDFDPVGILKTIEKYKVTFLYGVPAMFSFIMNVPDFDKYDLSSLRAVGSVGAVLPRPTLEKIWEKMTPNLYDHLGMQETGFIAVSKPDMKRANPDFVGPPTCLHEIRIVDEQGRAKAVGEIGEVIFRFPDGAGEYWKNEAKTKEAFRNGWFYSGDLGKLDQNGHIAIVGRLKDMIVSGGYNVFAADVEEQVLKHPKIIDCAVIGLPDETWGEKVVAVVKLKPGETCTEKELVDFCKERMAHYKAPKSVFFDDVLRTPTGKAVKFAMVEKYKGSAQLFE